MYEIEPAAESQRLATLERAVENGAIAPNRAFADIGRRESIHPHLVHLYTSMSLRSTLACSAAAAVVAVVSIDYIKGLLRRMRIPKTVTINGCGEVGVSTARSGGNVLVTLDWDKIFGILPFKIPFCSAVVCNDGSIYVSGSIGLAPPVAGEKPSIVTGGPKPEMIRTMVIIEAILQACGAGIENITMAHCYLVDNTPERFKEMNEGYLEFMADRPLPARITVGCSALALGSVVEVDVIAKKL